jgi:hypothetical protein
MTTFSRKKQPCSLLEDEGIIQESDFSIRRNDCDTEETIYMSSRRVDAGTEETAFLSSRRIDGVLKKRFYCPEV